MKLFSNETKAFCATEFWISHNKRDVSLNAVTDIDGVVDLNELAGIYELYEIRDVDHQLMWYSNFQVIKRGNEKPPCSAHGYIELVKSFEVCDPTCIKESK